MDGFKINVYSTIHDFIMQLFTTSYSRINSDLINATNTSLLQFSDESKKPIHIVPKKTIKLIIENNQLQKQFVFYYTFQQLHISTMCKNPCQACAKCNNGTKTKKTKYTRV